MAASKIENLYLSKIWYGFPRDFGDLDFSAFTKEFLRDVSRLSYEFVAYRKTYIFKRRLHESGCFVYWRENLKLTRYHKEDIIHSKHSTCRFLRFVQDHMRARSW